MKAQQLFAAAILVSAAASGHASTEAIPIALEVDVCPKTSGDLDYYLASMFDTAGLTRWGRDIGYKDPSAGPLTDYLFGNTVIVMGFDRFNLSAGVTRLRMKMWTVKNRFQVGDPGAAEAIPKKAMAKGFPPEQIDQAKAEFEKAFPC